MKKSFTKKEHSDSGLALLLLTLVAGLWLRIPYTLHSAIAEVLVLLTAPVLIYPFTFLWLNISDLLGRILSKILLAVIFFVFVLPVALIRKAMGKDALQLKKFKHGNDSVFTERNHTFTKTDFTTQY